MPLYWTSLSDIANIRGHEGKSKQIERNQGFEIELGVEVAANW